MVPAELAQTAIDMPSGIACILASLWRLARIASIGFDFGIGQSQAEGRPRKVEPAENLKRRPTRRRVGFSFLETRLIS
jgi:hypothetical protein